MRLLDNQFKGKLVNNRAVIGEVVMFLRSIGAPELIIMLMFLVPTHALVWFISRMQATRNSLKELEETVKCSSCNKHNISDSAFCRYCGTNLSL